MSTATLTPGAAPAEPYGGMTYFRRLTVPEYHRMIRAGILGEDDPLELLDFLQPRLAHFMLPRYVRLLADLPRTPTQKVEKYVLRQQGITDDTWDRVKAGVEIKRQKIG